MSKNKPYRSDIKTRIKIRKLTSNESNLTSTPHPVAIRKLNESLKISDKSQDFMKKNAADYAPDLLWEFFSDDQSSTD